MLGGPDYDTIRGWRDIVMQKAQETGKFVNMDSNYRESQPDIRVQIDRQRAADLGVSVEDIGRTLELMFGETRGLDLRQPRRRISGDHARPRPGSRDAERSHQHLHPRRERRARSALVLRDA